jgi:integrase
MIGHVFRRGKTWSYKFDGPAEPVTGKRRQISKGGFPDENAALRAMVMAQTELAHGSYVKPSRLTVGAFLAQWLEAMREAVKPTTFTNYRDYIEAYVVPHLGRRRLQDLDVPTINAFYRRLREQGRRKADTNSRMYAYWKQETDAGRPVTPRQLAGSTDTGIHAARAAVRRYRAGRVPAHREAGLAPKTVKNIHRMLHRAFDDAVSWRYLAFNPVVHAAPPRGRTKRPTPWTPRQVSGFLSAARSDRFYAMWVLVTTTGMRRSELAHLDRQSLNLDAGRLVITSTRVVVAGRAAESDGKSDNSRRTIALDRFTIAALRAYVEMVDDERAAWGPTYPDHGLLFVYPDGRPLHPDTITARFNRIVDRAGLPRIRLHDVRHTYATVSLDAGVNPKIVSERIGHASLAFTLQIYTHRSEGRDRDAATAVAALLVPVTPEPSSVDLSRVDNPTDRDDGEQEE